MLEPVFFRPSVRRAIQLCRSGGTAVGTGISIGATSALPIRPPPAAGVAGAGEATGGEATGGATGAASGAATGADGAGAAAAGAGAGVAGGFFRKKLNIREVSRIT